MKKVIVAAAVGMLAMVSGQAMANDLGEKTFKSACFACHQAGVAGAPKFGNKDAWGPRIAQGMDVLNQHALEGFKGKTGVMPKKGGRADLSDDAVKAAVEYMVNGSK